MKDDIVAAFNSIAEDYDSERQALIPCFHDFYQILVDLLPEREQSPSILDIGSGTGLLSQYVLKKFPDAKLTLIDISEEMLSIAKKRFGGNTNVSYILYDYTKYTYGYTYNYIVSALSIHHLDDHEKKSFYEKIYSLLHDSGKFVNGDQFRAPTDENEQMYQRYWHEKIEASNLSEQSKRGAYGRMRMDKTATVESNLGWLKMAGFHNVDLCYKYFNFGVIAGDKRRVYER